MLRLGVKDSAQDTGGVRSAVRRMAAVEDGGGSDRHQGQGGRGHGGAERPGASRRRRGQTAADQSPNPAEATPGGGGDAPAGGGDTQSPAEAPPAAQNTPVDATPARAEVNPLTLQNQPEQRGFGGVQYPESGPTRSVAQGLLEATRPNGDIFNPLTSPGQAGPILGRMTEFNPPRTIRFGDNGQERPSKLLVLRTSSRHTCRVETERPGTTSRS